MAVDSTNRISTLFSGSGLKEVLLGETLLDTFHF